MYPVVLDNPNISLLHEIRKNEGIQEHTVHSTRSSTKNDAEKSDHSDEQPADSNLSHFSLFL